MSIDGAPERPAYTLSSNTKFEGFQRIEITEVDESKPWKPPLKVKITLADGSEEIIDASTALHTFEKESGEKLTVSAAAAGHIDALHIKGTEPGSRFSYDTLEAFLADLAEKLPNDITDTSSPSAFDIDMGKKMGAEGLASMQELLRDGIIAQTDIDTVKRYKWEVGQVNETGDQAAKENFVAQFAMENPNCKIQFQMIRAGAVLVPTVKAPKRATNKVFLVFGQTDPPQEGVKTMWTAAPGRYMPRHPIPAQFQDSEGGTEGEAYKEASAAWFDTVMLV